MQGVTSPDASEFQDPFTCQDPFLVADRRIVSFNEGRKLQRRGSHKCMFPRGQEKKEMDQAARRARLQRPRIGTIQNVRGASLDRAVAHDRARRPWHHLRSAPRASRTNGQAVELDARSRGTSAAFAQARRHAAPRSALRLAAPGNARFRTGCQVRTDGVSRKRHTQDALGVEASSACRSGIMKRTAHMRCAITSATQPNGLINQSVKPAYTLCKCK